MKRLIILLVVLSLTVVLAACSSSSSSEAQSATVDGWVITTSNFELVDNLASSISSQQYNGGSIEVEYKEKPAAGTLSVW